MKYLRNKNRIIKPVKPPAIAAIRRRTI